MVFCEENGARQQVHGDWNMGRIMYAVTRMSKRMTYLVVLVGINVAVSSDNGFVNLKAGARRDAD